MQQEILETYSADLYLKGLAALVTEEEDVKRIETKRDKLLIRLLDKLTEQDSYAIYIDGSESIDISPTMNTIYLCFDEETFYVNKSIRIEESRYILESTITISDFSRLKANYGADLDFDKLSVATYIKAPE